MDFGLMGRLGIRSPGCGLDFMKRIRRMIGRSVGVVMGIIRLIILAIAEAISTDGLLLGA